MKLFFICLTLLSSNLCAISLSTRKMDNDIQYLVTDPKIVIERPLGVDTVNVPGIGEVSANLSLQYKSVEIRLQSDNTLKLILRYPSYQPTAIPTELFPQIAKNAGGFFELSRNLTAAEHACIAQLFELNKSYVNIDRAALSIQFKFLNLLNIIQKKFPEIRFLIVMPLRTRILYATMQLFGLQYS
jgi:hypothetical protein